MKVQYFLNFFEESRIYGEIELTNEFNVELETKMPANEIMTPLASASSRVTVKMENLLEQLGKVHECLSKIIPFLDNATCDDRGEEEINESFKRLSYFLRFVNFNIVRRIGNVFNLDLENI